MSLWDQKNSSYRERGKINKLIQVFKIIFQGYHPIHAYVSHTLPLRFYT